MSQSFELLAKPIQQVLWDMEWRELRPIQVAAIQTILMTEADALITARTASGKTEAAFLPVLSKLCEEPGSSIGALYVGPLKALINDQFLRLERLCERAEIPVHRWHGDVDGGKKEKTLKAPGGVMLITPESLESFFVNRSSRMSGLFADLKYIVIDEIHALVGRERGLQLRSLLFRLRRYTHSEPRLIGLSATVGNQIDYYREWMRPNEVSRVIQIEDTHETKEVRFGIHAYLSPPQAKTTQITQDRVNLTSKAVTEETLLPPSLIQDALREFRGKKNLIFCNSRSSVESLAHELNEACRRDGSPAEFLVHHGSVSKELREFTEETMRAPRPSTAVCSATLELGIDIGSVRTVGQLGSCWSSNSQAQRLGRSGRRDNEPRRMRIMLPLTTTQATDDLVEQLYPDLIQAIAVSELMFQRWFEPPATVERDDSTLVQQILSIAAEHGGVYARDLHKQLILHGAFRSYDTATFTDVLRSLGKSGLLEQMQDGLLVLTQKGESVVHDRHFYSAFNAPQELTVRAAGRHIGNLSAMFVPQIGDHFLLAGRRWRTVDIDIERGEISVVSATGNKPPKFFGSAGEIHPRVHAEMRRILAENKDFTYLNDEAKRSLESARSVYGKYFSGGNLLIELGPQSCLWVLWAGTRVQRTLLFLSQEAGLSAKDEGFAIQFEQSLAVVIAKLKMIVEQIHELGDEEWDFEVQPWRKFDEFLSPLLLRAAFLHDRLDVAAAITEIVSLYSAYPAVIADIASNSIFLMASDEGSNSEIETDSRTTKHHACNLSDSELYEYDFIAIDLETTGLHPAWSKIVEIGAIRFRLDGTEIGRFVELINPGCQIPYAATEIHGITDAMVKHSPTIESVLPKFMQFVQGEKVIFLAHNSAFDQRFLQIALRMQGLSPPTGPILDTLTMAQSIFPVAKNHQLSALCVELGIDLSHAHRAVHDADATRNVFCKMLHHDAGQRVVRQFLMDNCQSFANDSSAPIDLPERFENILKAIKEHRDMRINYGSFRQTMQEITPKLLFTNNGLFYMTAVCGNTGNNKTYRLDRLIDYEII
jgi:ATP-dependent helicase Lhr and Lhr-like helicase